VLFRSETIEEEEKHADKSENVNEIEKLKAESEMPIEDLLKMYGMDKSNLHASAGVKRGYDDEDDEEEEESYDEDEEDSESYSDNDDEGDDEDEPEIGDDQIKTSESSNKKAKTDNTESQETATDVAQKPSNLSHFLNHDTSNSGDEDEDCDFDPDDYQKKKKIKIGDGHQAELLAKDVEFVDSSQALWNPDGLSENHLIAYLKDAFSLHENAKNCTNKSEFKENEMAFVILHNCNYIVADALKRYSEFLSSPDNIKWTEEQKDAFEEGLCEFGKDFRKIKEEKLNDFSIAELVQHYYSWKKSERHDQFVNKYNIKKKHFLFNPTTMDLMERFITEREQNLKLSQPTSTTDASSSVIQIEQVAATSRPLNDQIEQSPSVQV